MLSLYEEEISTHTPLAGRDGASQPLCISGGHFYSHAPRGARRPALDTYPSVSIFLLTRPSRGATGNGGYTHVRIQFLLTRPSRGATAVCICRA